jgi:hypothetical protein
MKIFNFTLAALSATALILLSGCAATKVCDKTADENHLQIGWGKRSLAKDGPVPITGQFHLRVSLGQYTPVIAQAMAMTNKTDAVIFVSADMVSVNSTVWNILQEILKKEAPEIPAEKIILKATHTHAGPSSNAIAADYPRQVKVVPADEMQKFVARQIADAVKEAWAKRAPGSIAYGYGFATTGHSRRTIYFDDTGKRMGSTTGFAVNGKGRMYGNTNDDMFDGYEAGTDSFINLFYTFDKKGKLTGAVINVPCPSQTGEMAWMLHASFWHNVREKLTAKYGDVGVIAQSAAAGDLAPRQLHYRAAELRRYKLKYAKEWADFMKNPMIYPPRKVWQDGIKQLNNADAMEYMRAEDIANRIVAAFDEVLSWAGKDKMCNPVLKHEVKTLQLSRRVFPKELIEEEKKLHEQVSKIKYIEGGDPWEQLYNNSKTRSRRGRIGGLLKRYELQSKEPYLTTDIHVVRIGDIAFASNRFELFMDYMHRIQARSPFEQTFIVQLVVDKNGTGSYLATEKAIANKGYSATPYCNQVSPAGGQELVNETLKVLKDLKK